jgi:hypothetical protein
MHFAGGRYKLISKPATIFLTGKYTSLLEQFFAKSRIFLHFDEFAFLLKL